MKEVNKFINVLFRFHPCTRICMAWIIYTLVAISYVVTRWQWIQYPMLWISFLRWMRIVYFLKKYDLILNIFREKCVCQQSTDFYAHIYLVTWWRESSQIKKVEICAAFRVWNVLFANIYGSQDSSEKGRPFFNSSLPFPTGSQTLRY